MNEKEIELTQEQLVELIGKVFDERLNVLKERAKAEPEAKREIDKTILWRDTIQKAITLGSLSLPAELYADVMQAVFDYGIVRANAMRIPATRSAKVPVMGEITAYQVSEAEAITEGANPITLKDFSLSKIAGLIVLTPELVETWDISNYLVRTMGLAIAKVEDQIGISNIASDSNQTLATVTALTSLAYDSLVSMLGAVSPVFQKNAMWILGQSAFTQINKLKDTQNRPLVDFQGGMSTLLGKKFIVVPDSLFPADHYALYGSFDAVICAYDNAIRLETFTSGTVGTMNLIVNDVFAIRAVEKYNAMPVFGNAFAVLKKQSGGA